MVKKEAVLVLLLLLLPLAVAQNDELFNYHALNLELSITNSFDIVPTAGSYVVDYVSAELSWYPRDDYRQKSDYISTEPEAEFREDEGFFFEWIKPSKTSFLLEENSRLNANHDFVHVIKKVFFPLKNLDPSYSQYLEPQEIIDINEKIRSKASEIVQGENDLYVAVFRIAEWVEDNVEYDLSTVTTEATQKASWVMDNKKGVCDEITSLFIAMCRSLGIPARFVTGISYSNINLQNNGWGPHGWAEVYFPGTGWVPFDVTYKELGFIDATHIKLKTSLDSKETSINYASKSKNTDIKPGELEFSVNVLSKDYKIKPIVGLKAEIAEPEVGFGSYNVVILTVENLKNYYVTTRVGLANVNELSIIGNQFQDLVLEPGESKKVYWLVRVSSSLQKRFIYTFPMMISASAGEKTEVDFKVEEFSKVYSEEYMRLLMIEESADEKPYSQKVVLSCNADNVKVYLNDSVNISCRVSNDGDNVLRSLDICFDTKCSVAKIGVGENAKYNYLTTFNTLGIKTLVFSAKNDLVDKSCYIVIDVQDQPLIEIKNISFPEKIKYEGSGEISFFISKISTTIPQEVIVNVDHKILRESWKLQTLQQDYKFRMFFRGQDFYLGKNDFRITVTYADAEGKKYSVYEDFSIMLENPAFIQRIMIWLNMLEYKLEEWVKNI